MRHSGVLANLVSLVHTRAAAAKTFKMPLTIYRYPRAGDGRSFCHPNSTVL